MYGEDEFDGFGALQAPDAAGGVAEIPARITRIFSNYLYSAQFWPAGVPIVPGRFALFVAALNQPGQGFVQMTSLETNLRSGGRVPDGESWTISHMGICPRPDADPDDVVAFISNVACNFTKRTYEQIMGPAFFWPGGCGVSGVATTTLPAAQFIAVNNGVPAPSAMTRFATPIELASGETFSFSFDFINGFTPNADLIGYLRLYGRFAEVVPA